MDLDLQIRKQWPEELGYHFYPSDIPNYPGHPRLDVCLNEHPTGRHFDPRKVQFIASSKQGGVEKITVHHPWAYGRRYRVTAGLIILTDRDGKEVEAFSFGGSLQVETEGDRTLCSLVSSAPIFLLTSSLTLPMWLTAEVEILFAALKARSDPHHPDTFEEKLAGIDPFLLYTCCLQAVLARSCDPHSDISDLDHHGEHFLRAEVKRLQDNGSWPADGCTLEGLFLDKTA